MAYVSTLRKANLRRHQSKLSFDDPEVRSTIEGALANMSKTKVRPPHTPLTHPLRTPHTPRTLSPILHPLNPLYPPPPPQEGQDAATAALRELMSHPELRLEEPRHGGAYKARNFMGAE